MYSRLLGVTALIAILSAGTWATPADAKDARCTWVDAPCITDGDLQEWIDLPITTFAEPGVVTAFANDRDHLYIQFRFRDPKWARAIRMAGLEIWVNTKGKKSRATGIRFRGGPSLEELRSRGPEKARRRPASGEAAIDMDDFFTFQDPSQKIPQVDINTSGAQGPAACHDTSMGFFVYEFAVPLNKRDGSFYGINAESGQKLMIGMIWGDMSEFRESRQRPDGMQGGGGRGGGMKGGGGGRGGGGMKGGMGGGGRGGGIPGGSGDRGPGGGIEKQEFWVKTTLATAPGDNLTE